MLRAVTRRPELPSCRVATWNSCQQERQKRENFIVAERVETIEFNEPTADFFKNLTSEEQYAWLKTKKGRGKGKKPELRAATIAAIDKDHDLALLKISGDALPAMQLGDASKVREGQTLIFTGFPIGMVLGFYPVTHRAMVSSITPIILPAHNSRQLNAKMINQLQKAAYAVFQLDGTAYPGSSGSPLYDPETGLVYGVINMVFVKGKKEAALSNPSGITYAIPGNYINELLKQVSK